DGKAGNVQTLDGIRSKVEHAEAAQVIQIADFFDDSAVAVEKNGGAKWRCIRQGVLLLARATSARRRQRPPAGCSSCSDDRWGSGAGSRGCKRDLPERGFAAR